MLVIFLPCSGASAAQDNYMKKQNILSSPQYNSKPGLLP
jgi:hypothetical protein